MTRDLRFARIYFTKSGSTSDQQREDALEGFKKATGFIRRTLAGHLDLRYMPDLQFRYDESYDHGQRIESILQAIKTDDAKNSNLP
jgi:ribosome-binding factor A